MIPRVAGRTLFAHIDCNIDRMKSPTVDPNFCISIFMTFYLGRPVALVLRLSEYSDAIAMALSCVALQRFFHGLDPGGDLQSAIYCSEPANPTQLGDLI